MKKGNVYVCLENTTEKTSVPTGCWLGICTEGRETVELLHDLFELVLAALKI